ncbi:MAG: PD-(D/E)XK nuclease family protein [Chthoniobacterales bacterium]
MQLELELQSNRRHALLLGSSPEAAWEGVAEAWFTQATAEAWKKKHPAVVVVPTRGQIQALKGKVLEAGLSTLGVEFVTPPYLRALLAVESGSLPPSREHLRFLLAVAAEQLLAEDKLSEAEHLAAVSVRRTPDHLLRLLEQLSSAGTQFEQVDLPAFRPVVQKFRANLNATAFEIFPEADRNALAQARGSNPTLGQLLITGFHGGHWPLWHLLQAAVHSSEHATVILQNPREHAEGLDVAWIGSWEEAFGEATPVAGTFEPAGSERATLFLAGLDTREEVEAITAVTHQFLAEENCRRLGIIFPGPGALSRLVASALTRRGIAHYDAMGQMAPGIFEEPIFQSWLELQRTPRLAALLRFLTAVESDHPLFTAISREAIADGLQRALGALAIDDLKILIASARDRERKGELLSAALDQIRFLPSQATFADYLKLTREAFEHLGWQERWREIKRQASWAPRVRAEFSATIYLRWIEEIANSFRVTRDAAGAHPYARVHLLTPAQAEDQTWSHLILTSLNDRVWPAAPVGDFLPGPQIEALNESRRQINRTATRRGRQGEGHVTVREGRALFLGAAQHRQLAEAQFASLIENTTHGVAFTASVIQEDAPERISNPSEFLNRAYHAAHGHSLSQQQMRALRSATRRWLDHRSLEPQIELVETPGIRQTRLAYDARRAIAPSNEYDFALRTAPDEIEPLSVSEVEGMLKAPAIVWLRRYLGVEGEEDAAYAWNATVGKWTHGWLASVSDRPDGFVAFPTEEEITKRIGAGAERKRIEVENLCRQAGRRLPDWWESGWEGALCVAQTLGRILGTAKDWPWLAAELRLDAQPIDLGEDNRLLLRGRADLLLGKTASAPTSLQVPELWIIDFKTGNKDALSKGLKGEDDQRAEKVRRKVLKGDALQLSLYAKAVKQCGAANVRVSLLSPNVAKAEPQLALEDFEQCRDAFRELARMQATGIFGFKGTLRNAYAFTQPYPIATLAIDPEIVDERWEKTHEALVVESGYFR